MTALFVVCLTIFILSVYFECKDHYETEDKLTVADILGSIIVSLILPLAALMVAFRIAELLNKITVLRKK